jgi:hypothetical protein
MSDSEAKIKITADTSSLQPGLDAAGNAINASLKNMGAGFQGLKTAGAASFTGIAQAAVQSANLMTASHSRASQGLLGMWSHLTSTISKNIHQISSLVQSMHKIHAMLTKKEALNHAFGAASATYKSIAAIPIVGPFLAPPAAAAAFAASAAFGNSISSAAGGYDIPAGINPLTQLHAREMVLPAKYADIIRELATQGQGQGAASQAAPVIHVHAVDAHSVRRLFNDHGSELVAALKGQHRNFAVIR